jgi:hypothetical protein
LFGVPALLLEARSQVLGRIDFGDGREDLLDARLADVDEHIGVGEALDAGLLLLLLLRLLVVLQRQGPGIDARRGVAAKVLFEDLAIGDVDDAVVVEAEPSTIGGGLDKDKVVATVDVARVDEDAV